MKRAAESLEIGAVAKRRLAIAAALVAGAALVAIVAARGLRDGGEPSRCADGLIALGPRCCGEGQRQDGGRCTGTPSRCADAQEATPDGCVPREAGERLAIGGGRLRIGPGDWEAQGVVKPHEADVASFELDVFEVTEARWGRCARAAVCQTLGLSGEPGRPVTGVTCGEAATFCRFASGRLPSRDELAFAMSGESGLRYPWGDTGAVCRRAAWGLASGPCASGGAGPDLAGAHPDGKSREGLHDLAGNVAEWTTSPEAREGFADVLGGSWADGEAAALRGWNLRTVPLAAREPTIGFRCAYTLH
jgi:sulfatase modifying factor 1